ncbi:MAG: hypothetical protein QM755_13995 [Luteolibacter sp.]
MKRSFPSSSSDDARFRAMRHYHRGSHQQGGSWDEWVGGSQGASMRFWFKLGLSVSAVVIVALVVIGALRMGGI